jgi:hypothetical protein
MLIDLSARIGGSSEILHHLLGHSDHVHPGIRPDGAGRFFLGPGAVVRPEPLGSGAVCRHCDSDSRVQQLFLVRQLAVSESPANGADQGPYLKRLRETAGPDRINIDLLR